MNQVTQLSVFVTAMVVNAPLLADSTVTMNDDTLVQVKNGMARMAPAGSSNFMVYDARRRVLIHVDPARGTYMELDEQTLEAQAEALGEMREQMAVQMEAMRGQLQNLPEAQRRMIEQQMDSMMAGSTQPDPKPQYKAVKKGSRKLSGFECTDYQLLEGNTPVAEACVADAPGAGMSKDDFATLASMTMFMRSIANQARKVIGPMASGFDYSVISEIEGFPVQMTDKRSGNHYGVVSVANTGLADALFTDYQKLRKEEMPTIPGR